ncbi:MAG: hypothetical protein JWO81_1828 [Alphaproteobacteria bacterium]|nr:hypothetical protein [Alphaproteobacteria bacterium]
MMLFLIAALAAAPAAPAPKASAPLHCLPPTVSYAKGAASAHSVRRLGEEPPASHYLAVWRVVGGCSEPAVVRTGIGR